MSGKEWFEVNKDLAKIGFLINEKGDIVDLDGNVLKSDNPLYNHVMRMIVSKKPDLKEEVKNYDSNA